MEPDPSYAQLREVIIESIAIPLGSSVAKLRLDKKSWFLFYGPTGTGKTLVIRAIQTECNCIVIDLSPDNLEGKFADKKELKRIFWMSIIVAKNFQPSVVMVEDV
jgi:ATP-dependent 26S proteasome regulatory subunit